MARVSIPVLLKPPVLLPGDLPIVSREIIATADGAPLPVITIPVAQESATIVVAPGSKVSVTVVDVDSSGLKSDPSPPATLTAPSVFAPEVPAAPALGTPSKVA